MFSDRETLELLSVFKLRKLASPFDLYLFVLFVELFHMYLFVTIANVVDSLNHIFFLLGECQPVFNVWNATHFLQFSSGNVPLNFEWLSHDALSLTINLLIVSFSFIRYPYFCVGCHTFFASFLNGAVPLLLVWMSHKCSVCPLPYLCVNVTRARLYFLCVNVTRISLCLHYF